MGEKGLKGGDLHRKIEDPQYDNSSPGHPMRRYS